MQLSYERGKYTDVKVSAEDMRSLWKEKNISATDYYNDYPEVIISDLAQIHAGLISSDIDLPTFDNRVLIEFQRVDTTLDEVLTEICDRFGYYPTITADNKVSARKISDNNTVDHTYSDTTKILSLVPDDKYSDFTNRVTVTGQERTYIDVTYPEERIAQMNGTVGWFGCKQDYHIPYSQDESRTCINPRLVILESAKSIGYKLAALSDFNGFNSSDISESISYVDPDNKYCTVTVSCPDLIPAAIEAGMAMVGSLFIPDIPVMTGETTGETIRIGTRLSAMFKLSLCSILSAVGNYQFEIWATPTGRVRRSIQGTANDLNQQQEMGVVVEKKIDDPLCYSVAECTLVAGNELMVARLQRNRVKLQKVAHLQDEDGDTIKFKHPNTGADVKLFITDLKRTYKKAVGADSDGYFLDDVEGWIVG